MGAMRGRHAWCNHVLVLILLSSNFSPTVMGMPRSRRQQVALENAFADAIAFSRGRSAIGYRFEPPRERAAPNATIRETPSSLLGWRTPGHLCKRARLIPSRFPMRPASAACWGFAQTKYPREKVMVCRKQSKDAWTDEQLFKIEQKMQAERVRYILRTQVCPPEWINALIAEVWELRDKLQPEPSRGS